MASINNWLAFSLSPHELSSSQPHHERLISGDDDVSAGDCFGLSAGSPSEPPLGMPTLRPDVPFGILEAFNRTNHQHQDWNMKSLDFKGGSSDLSMVVGSSHNRMSNRMEVEEPKLEDFLGSHSSSGDYLFSDYNDLGSSAAHTNSSIGLSMIKSWLRNQPAPPQVADEKSGGVVVAGNHGDQSNSHPLSLSMSMASQSGSALTLKAACGTGGAESSSSPEKVVEAASRKSIETFGQRTSIYRGVTRHRWTGRYEAHLWDNSCRREGQSRKGRQVYLGGYDKEDKAARAYDLAALKYWGPTTTTNFPVSNYEKELEEMKNMTRQEYVASLRRKSSGFSRGASIYRGVTRHHQHGRWQARIGRVAGNKDLYLGTFSTQEEAAEAYDIAAIKFRGLNAVTNFDMSRYDVKSILESSTLPIGGAAKRLKDVSDQSDSGLSGHRTGVAEGLASQYSDAYSAAAVSGYGWPTIAFQQPQPLSFYYPYAQQRGWCKQEQDPIVPAAAAISHSFQDMHHLNTHDFFQPSAVAMNGFLSLQDPGGGAATSLEHSTGSNSVVYSAGAGSYPGYTVGGGGGFMLPMGTNHRSGSGCFGDEEGKQMEIENYLGSSYGYLGNQHLPDGVMKPTDGQEQGGGFTGWVPATAVSAQAMASRAAGGNAASLFSAWNDS